MKPSLGRIVEYTLNEQDADRINKRRQDAESNFAIGETGFILHAGNPVTPGDNFPLMITRVWAPGVDATLVNGQVMLDGNDTLWVSSVGQGEGFGTFREFPRV